MIRREFIDTIDTIESLLAFCDEEHLDICDEVYSEDEMDDYLNDNLSDYAYNNHWRNVLSFLESIPAGYDYYIRNEDLDEFYGIDRTVFLELKDEALSIMDDGGYWDDEEINVEEIMLPFGDDTPDEFEADTSIPLDEFFVSNAQEIQQIIAETAAS